MLILSKNWLLHAKLSALLYQSNRVTPYHKSVKYYEQCYQKEV